MKKIIKVTLLVLMMILLSQNTFAEKTYTESMETTVDDKNATVEEIELENGVDNSNLLVKVIKVTNDVETIIYTGVLGEYEDGVWSKFDFGNLDFMVILDWDTMEEEAIYIVPLEKIDYANGIMIETTDYSTNNINSDGNVLMNEEITTQKELNEEYSSSEIFVIKDAILENTNDKVNSLQNATVLSKVVLATKQTNEISPAIFVALYNNGILVNVKMLDATLNSTADSVIEYTLNMPLTNISENMTLKIMTWDGAGTLKPYSIPLNIYYGYSIDVSTRGTGISIA